MKTRTIGIAVVAALLGIGAGAVAATVSGDFQIGAEAIFKNAPGTMMVVHDRVGNSVFVENGIMAFSKKKGGGGTDAPNPGPPWGVCGGDTTVACETAYVTQSCKVDKDTKGIQNCQENLCHCLGADGGYMAAGPAACGACFVPSLNTPAQTLPAF